MSRAPGTTSSALGRRLAPLAELAVTVRCAARMSRIPALRDPSNGLTIRGGRRQEAAGVSAFIASLSRRGRGATRARILSWKLTAPKLIVVCAADTVNPSTGAPKIVGVELFRIRPEDQAPGELRVFGDFIGVHPDYRGQGLAKAMRSHAIEHFRQTGVLAIRSMIYTWNPPSLKSAEAVGFRPISRVPAVHRTGKKGERLIMEVRLSP